MLLLLFLCHSAGFFDAKPSISDVLFKEEKKNPTWFQPLFFSFQLTSSSSSAKTQSASLSPSACSKAFRGPQCYLWRWLASCHLTSTSRSWVERGWHQYPPRVGWSTWKRGVGKKQTKTKPKKSEVMSTPKNSWMLGEVPMALLASVSRRIILSNLI